MKRLLSFVLILVMAVGFTLTPAAADANEYRSWRQSDPRWGAVTFGASDTLSRSGCAITSVAILMVHAGAVSSDSSVFNPGIFCNWLKANGGVTAQGWLV